MGFVPPQAGKQEVAGEKGEVGAPAALSGAAAPFMGLCPPKAGIDQAFQAWGHEWSHVISLARLGVLAEALA